MWELNAEGKWTFNFSKLGRWWDNKHEIDIVALDPEEKNLILGECKYWHESVGINVLKNLEQKAEYVEWNRSNRKVWYVLFSINGFTSDLKVLAEQRDDVLLVE